MNVHPAADIFPTMSEAEIKDLAEDIKANGLHVPIVLHEGQILDGRNRLAACKLAGVEPVTVNYTGNDPVAFVWAQNVLRRHLTEDQKAALAVEMEPLFAEQARMRMLAGKAPDPGAETAPGSAKRDNTKRALMQAATTAKVAPKRARRAKAIKERAPEHFELVKAGELTIADAEKPIRAAERERKAAERAGRLRTLPVPTVRLEEADATQPLPLEDGSVDLIVTSPPYGLEKPYRRGDDLATGWYEFTADWLRQAFLVAKHGGRLALNVPLDTRKGGKRPTYAQAIQAALEVGWTYDSTIVWNEGNTTKGNRGLGSVGSPASPQPVAPVEMIVLFCKGEWGRTSTQPPNISHDEWQEYGKATWTFPGESHPFGGHPAAFPLELPTRLIKYLSFPGDVVLDPFVGSGTTVLAALRLKREPIGFDLDHGCIENSKLRLAADTEAEAAA